MKRLALSLSLLFHAHAIAGVWDTTHSSRPDLRSEMGSIVVDGTLYTCGGFDTTFTPSVGCESYRITDDSWDPGMSDLHIAWDHGKLIALDGRLYFIGGGREEGDP